MALLLFLMYSALVGVEPSRHELLLTCPDIVILVAINTYMFSTVKFLK